MTDPIAAAWRRLKGVIDPETAIDIVDLGLIYDIALEDAVLRVTMTFTTEACPVGPALIEEARLALDALPGVKGAEVSVTFDPPWTPDRITPEGRDRLAR